MASEFMTTTEVAEQLEIRTEQVVALIHANALEAIDISVGEKKPRWRVKRTSYEEFKVKRAHRPLPTTTRPVRRRKVKVTHSFFPNRPANSQR